MSFKNKRDFSTVYLTKLTKVLYVYLFLKFFTRAEILFGINKCVDPLVWWRIWNSEQEGDRLFSCKNMKILSNRFTDNWETGWRFIVRPDNGRNIRKSIIIMRTCFRWCRDGYWSTCLKDRSSNIIVYSDLRLVPPLLGSLKILRFYGTVFLRDSRVDGQTLSSFSFYVPLR